MIIKQGLLNIIFFLFLSNIYAKIPVNIIEKHLCFTSDWQMKTLKIISCGNQLGFNIDNIYILTDNKNFVDFWAGKPSNWEVVVFYISCANFYDGVTLYYSKDIKNRQSMIKIKSNCESGIKEIELIFHIKDLSKWEYLR